MTLAANNSAFIALIDDDTHSAHLLTRMLLAHGAPEVRHLGGGVAGRAALQVNLSDYDSAWPGLLVVDLKSHSKANLEFLITMQAVLRQKGVPVVVMCQPLDKADRESLLDVGAAEVFSREADIDAYRREAAGIVSFWARNQRLNAVGM